MPPLVASRAVRIHDVVHSFPNLKSVQGIDRYAERALVLPGLTIVQEGVPLEYLNYLRGIGLGAPATDGVLLVPPAQSLNHGLSDDQVARVLQALESGSCLEFFMPTEDDRAFVQGRLGSSYSSRVWGTVPELTVKVNDKIWLRSFAKQQRLRIRFPNYRIFQLRDVGGICGLVENFIASHNGAFLKNANLSSGEGLFPVQGRAWRDQVLQALTQIQNGDPQSEILVDAAYFEHLPLSVQLELDDGGVHSLYSTLMTISGGKVHEGNLIAPRGLPGVPPRAEQDMQGQSRELAQALWAIGYRGYLGLDFIYVPATGEVFVIEANGRVTGAAYPLSVALQAQRHGLENWAVISANVLPARRGNFAALQRQFKTAGLLFDGKTGVLPVCVSLLESVKPKVMLYSVGANAAAAQGKLEEACELLEAA